VPTAGPYVVLDVALSVSETAALDTRIRATTGRFGETAFVLAALAAALEAAALEASALEKRALAKSRAQPGDLLFPLAADVRAAGESRLFSNHHGFSLLLLQDSHAMSAAQR
jgi:hypothetical protein